MGIVQGAAFYARGIGLSPLALARLDLDTVREVGTAENKTFCALARLNLDTVREVGIVQE